MFPCTLQSANNELFEVLETLKEKKSKLGIVLHLTQESSISQKTLQENEIQAKISKLNSELASLKVSLNSDLHKKSELEKLIGDTEIAYQKIIESSTSLLKVLKNQEALLET